MTVRGFYALLLGALMLITSLSVGSEGAFVLGCVSFCAWAFSLVSVLLSYATFRITQELGHEQTLRGTPCTFRVRVRMACVLPIAPLHLRVALPSGQEGDFSLRPHVWGETTSENAFSCPHVGIFPVGVLRVRIGDCFGLFSLSHGVQNTLPQLMVLPNPAESTLPDFAPADGEAKPWQRAFDDTTTPADTRAWQQGDELKRVHWKLSMRKQSLMVRTYETPRQPDALILLDFASPAVADVRRAAAIDALTEACVGAARLLLEAGHPTRMPLPGKAGEFSGERIEALVSLQTALARASFTHGNDFARSLYTAARRVRRPGTVIALSTRLTPAIADAAISLRRAGPRMRFVLHTSSEPTAEQRKLLALLASSGIDARNIAHQGAEREERAK